MLSLILGFIPIALRLIGCVEAAEAMVAKIEARKKAQAVADMPVTKKELSDAADKGEL